MPPNSPLRGQKKQRRHYSGKKKRHTQKAQVIVHQESKRIIATAFGQGRTHDFRLFKESGVQFAAKTLCLADKGYTGITKLHPNSRIPVKKSKDSPLTPEEEKKANRALAKERISAEHVIGRLKVFRILSERYRNRRKRFRLRFNLIAAIYNLEIASS